MDANPLPIPEVPLSEMMDEGPMSMPVNMETCDLIDEDQDGVIDEGITCACPDEERCYGAAPETNGVGQCMSGQSTCDSSGEMWLSCDGWIGPEREKCDFLDNDCDGQVDEYLDECNPCTAEGGNCLTQDLNIDGDCVTVECPNEAPYPIACDIIFDGGDPRGCVANQIGDSVIFFKEGNDCNVGNVQGSLTCSAIPGDGLNAMNCPMNKVDPFYPQSAEDCPD